MLSKCYLTIFDYNGGCSNSIQLRVVICFQNVIWRFLITIIRIESISVNVLWFAFKMLFDDFWLQYFLKLTGITRVVICFQNVIWRFLITIPGKQVFTIFSLWFAFKMLFDDFWLQSYQSREHWTNVVICFQNVIWRFLITIALLNRTTLQRCDLLSKCYLTIFDYNANMSCNWYPDVVICFQNVIWRFLITICEFFYFFGG